MAIGFVTDPVVRKNSLLETELYLEYGLEVPKGNKKLISTTKNVGISYIKSERVWVVSIVDLMSMSLSILQIVRTGFRRMSKKQLVSMKVFNVTVNCT